MKPAPPYCDHCLEVMLFDSVEKEFFCDCIEVAAIIEAEDAYTPEEEDA